MDHLPTTNADQADHVRLMEAIANDRSRPAFVALFQVFAPKLKAYYRKGGVDAPLAEDLVQEVMLNVWRLADRYRAALGSPSTWIFTIARNRLIDHVRQQRARSGDLSDPSLQPEPIQQSDDLIDQQRRYSSLKAAMTELPQEQADMLKMAFFEHKPHSLIAEESGLPLGTVKSRIRLAMKRLRETLATEFGEEP